MNKWAKRFMAMGMCASLCIGAVGVVSAQNVTAGQEQNQNKEEKQTAAIEQTKGEAFGKEDKERNTSKDETVYVLSKADGSVQKIIVSDWLQNALENESIADKTELDSVENLKGDETYTDSADNTKIWNAQGDDIYYQGNIEKELPVKLTVTYKLDGKEVSAEEIAGKSGRVTVRYEYESCKYEMVELNGSREKIYVPFTVITGMLLDSDSFRNVEVSSGKLINDGNHTIVAGFAFPGLQDNLGLDEDKIDIPDFVEITADATDFEWGMTVTVATNEIFSSLDAEKLENLEEAEAAIGELTDAMTKLMDGSSALYEGLETLLTKSNDLVAGVNQLVAGAKTLSEGTETLKTGAVQLKNGAAELSAGLSTLSSNSASLNSGAVQVFNTLLSAATTQIQAAGVSVPALTIENYAEVLNGVIGSLDNSAVYNQALQKVTSAVEGRRAEIEAGVTAVVRSQVEQQVRAAVQEQIRSAAQTQVTAQVIESAVGMSSEEYYAAVAAGGVTAEQQTAVEAAIEEQLAAVVAAQLESSDTAAAIAAETDAAMQSESIQATIAQNIEAQVQQAVSENMSSDTVQSQLAAASQGAATIAALKNSLDSYNSFYNGLCSYTSGVDSAASGAARLSSGAASLEEGVIQLNTGAATLYNGTMSLKEAMPALLDGIKALRDGSMELSDGLKQFNEQGVQKLADLVEGDLQEASARLKATIDVSKDYCNFAGLSDGMDAQVRFIYRTEEIR